MPEMTVDELNVKVTGDVSDVKKGLTDLKLGFRDLQKNAKNEISKIGDLFKKLQNTIRRCAIGQLIYREISGGVDSAISRLDTLNNYSKTMGNLGISGEDAEASLSRLSDALVGLPTTMDSAALAVQRFTSANGNIKASTEMFLALNNAVLAGGASAQAQASAVEQLSQSYAKGKPDMMEWRTAMQAMPAQLKQVAISMGYVSADQLGEALRSGKVSMNEFMVELTKLNKEGVSGFKSFEEQARNATGGVQIAMTNAKTAITRGLADIMNAIGQSNIAAFFNGITAAINRAVPYIVAFTRIVMTAVSAIAGLFGKTINSQASTTASSISAVGNSANMTAKKIDNTTKSTKGLTKAMKSLSGFDEMNVLTENKNSGNTGSNDSGVASLGSLSGVDLSAFDNITEKVSAADELFDKWMGKLQSFKNFVSKNFPTISALISGAFAGIGTLSLLKNFGTITTVFRQVKDAVGFVSLAFSTFFSEVATGNGVIAGLQSVLGATMTTALGIAAVAAAVVASLVYLWQTNDGFRQAVIDAVEACKAVLSNLWDNVLKPIYNFLKDLFNTIIKPIAQFIAAVVVEAVRVVSTVALAIWTNVLAPFANFLVDTLAIAIDGVIKIWEKIKPVVEVAIGTIKWGWDNVLKPVSEFFTNVLVGAIKLFGSVISSVFTTVKGIFGGIIDFITGVFTGDWEKAWQGVSDIFSSIFEGLKNIFKIPINWIIDGINKFISGLNKIKIPSWVPVVGGKGFNIGTIPRLAQGGIIDKATLAVVGEAGREAVLPLDRNTEWMNEFFDKMPKSNNPQTIVIQIGDETIAKKVVNWIRDNQYTTDEEVFAL